ncbi:MAG: FAD:protein FMN transferase [Muribaculum sp.]|nr:FAD:protein FMN transferase [Muribaculum sp.]
MKQSKIILIVTAVIMAVALPCCRTEKPFHRYEGFIWGTTFHITYASNVNLDDSIMAVMQHVDDVLSPFNTASLVSRINNNETAQTDELFRAVFRCSQDINRISDGAYDPTLGPVIDLWGFGPAGLRTKTPTSEQLDSALMSVGIADCALDSTGILIKKSPSTRFDFSSIAKGFGCDLVADLLSRNGVENYIVEIGGEVVVKGKSPRNAPWRVMVDAPIGENDTIVHDGIAVVKLTEGALATSGDYRNFHIMDDGVNATHIINPATGMPAHSEILSVTILAPDCMVADALATACSVLSVDSAKAMIDTIENVEALFVTRDSLNEKWVITATDAFPEMSR